MTQAHRPAPRPTFALVQHIGGPSSTKPAVERKVTHPVPADTDRRIATAFDVWIEDPHPITGCGPANTPGRHSLAATHRWADTWLASILLLAYCSMRCHAWGRTPSSRDRPPSGIQSVRFCPWRPLIYSFQVSSVVGHSLQATEAH